MISSSLCNIERRNHWASMKLGLLSKVIDDFGSPDEPRVQPASFAWMLEVQYKHAAQNYIPSNDKRLHGGHLTASA